MSSQYDQAYKPISEHQSNTVISPAKYNTWNTVPFIYTLDSYSFPQNANRPVHDSVSIESLRDVVSIELIQAAIPAQGEDLYVAVRLNGYSHVRSNNNSSTGSFCVVTRQNPADIMYSMRRIGGVPDDNYIYYFPEPSRINKLDIEFLRPTGAGYELVAGDNYLCTFEIRTLNRAPKIEARFNAGVQGPWN